VIDWESFLDRHNVLYQSRGGVTTRGNIAIHCPFCGPADHGYHLSISVAGRGWYCWLQKSHRGYLPHRLIQALIGCSWLEAESLAKGEHGAPSDRTMLEVIEMMNQPRFKPTQKQVAKNPLNLPAEFVEIRDRGFRRMFAGYLTGRGFADPEQVAADYGLLGAVAGRWAGRIIFPIWLDGELVCWTGRHVGTSRLRYLTLSSSDDPPARMPVKQTVLWYDRLKAAPAEATLVVTEGPFDALKVNYLGRDHGVYATCVYSKNISDFQIDLLLSLDFAKKILMFDPETIWDAEFSMLSDNGFESRFIEEIEDPGEFDKGSFDRFLRTLESSH